MIGYGVIWHGDSIALAPMIQGPIHCICTDPPFGMAFKSGFATTPKGLAIASEIANDEDVETARIVFLNAVQPLVELTADDAEMYVFTRWSVLGEWIAIVNELAPFVVKNTLIWDKETPGMGDIAGNWAFSYECIIYAKKGRREIPARRSSIIRVPRTPVNQHFHPTQKPVALLEILLKMSTSPGDLVVDPFSGSGSTVVAAARLGRRAIGIEKDIKYIEPSRERLNQGVFDL